MSTLTSPEEYDLVVLGSGEGGKYLAWTLARQGKRTVVIERRWIGGSCPNIACLPSKNLIHSAKVASHFFRSAEFGITKRDTHIDMTAVREREARMVTGLRRHARRILPQDRHRARSSAAASLSRRAPSRSS